MEQHTRWDDFLVAEHEMIERSMAVLKAGLEDIEATVAKPLKMKRAIDFLYEFGDKIHNRKEEDFLFPLMQERGIPTAGGPIGVMLMEHEAERKLLVEMSGQLATLATDSAETRAQFKARGLEYLAIRAEHIWKENDILYPMARKVMVEGDNDTLLAGFNRINSEAYGPDAVKKFQQMVEEVEKGDDAKKKLIQGLSYQQLDAIMEAMPFEVTFVDAEDTVAYFNRLDKEKLFPRTRSVVGRKVEKCHPDHSVEVVRRIVNGFKNHTMDKAEFWIDFRGDKVLIRYFPVYGDQGEYMGVLEVTQTIGWIQKIEGQKRLMD